MVYMDKAEFMTNNAGPGAGRKVLIDGGSFYGQKMADSIAPIPIPDIPMIIAAHTAAAEILSMQFPGAARLAKHLTEDLKKSSMIMTAPDPVTIEKWKRQSLQE